MFVCAGTWILGPHYLAEAQTTFEEAELLAFRETRDATFVVLGYQSEVTGAYQQLLVNGWSYANNAMPGRRYMATLAHLPALLHRDPRSALLGCIGTGTTVGGLTLHPELRKIVAVDLSEAVFDFAPLFVPLNHGFHLEPRVEKVVADVRHYLLRSSQTFDVITFEPPPPHDAGVVNLYSREFYALAKRRLARGRGRGPMDAAGLLSSGHSSHDDPHDDGGVSLCVAVDSKPHGGRGHRLDGASQRRS